MYQFLKFIVNSVKSVAGLLTSVEFAIGAFNVSLLDLFIGFLAMGIIIAVFWKGARA